MRITAEGGTSTHTPLRGPDFESEHALFSTLQ